MNILLVFVVAVVFLVLLMRGVVLYSETLIKVLVEKKHRESEMITETQFAPPEWNKRPRFRIAGLIGGGRLKRRLALQRVNQLIRYFHHTPLVDDEETRKNIINRLQGARQAWRKQSWDEIYPYK